MFSTVDHIQGGAFKMLQDIFSVKFDVVQEKCFRQNLYNLEREKY